MTSLPCKLCRAPTEKLFSHHHGYQEGSTYDIHYCENCDSSMASPLEVDEKIYELIYSKSSQVPGYDRYAAYSQAVLKKDNPLEFLASSEDVYWAVRKVLSEIQLKKSVEKSAEKSNDEMRILEVGCGYGYLTYSIAKQGLNVKGLDISVEAIRKARTLYGDHYIQADLMEYSKQNPARYHLIILTEVIEHVPDIYAILRAVFNMVAEGGSVVVTTPNKSIFSSDRLWHTDPPPVHLWWLSESSLRFVAHTLACSVRFVDFTEFNTGVTTGELTAKKDKRSGYKPSKPQTFDLAGNIRFRESVLMGLARRIIALFPSLRKSAQQLQMRLFLKQKFKRECSEKSQSLCAVLTKL